MAHLHWIDWTIVTVFMAFSLFAGFFCTRFIKNAADFTTASRGMGTYMAVASLSATELGLVTVMYFAQEAFKNGFSAFLYGIIAGITGLILGLTGFGVVRYRKTGVLKRLNATPLTAFEYLSAQILSRIFILMFTLAAVWIGCSLFFTFKVEGSYFDLFLIFLTGSICLSAYGLVIAARGTSEEFTSGVVNFITWPMMFLSEVWFSLEGSPRWIKLIAKLFPLTHMLSAVRKVMNDGARLADVTPELAVLIFMTAISIAVGAALFSWNK